MRKMTDLTCHSVVLYRIYLNKAGMKTTQQVLHFFKRTRLGQARGREDIIGIFKEGDMGCLGSSLVTSGHRMSSDKADGLILQILFCSCHNLSLGRSSI